MRKRQFIRHLLAERDKFELLLNRIGFSKRMTMPGVSGNWSVKDIIAHILAYEQYIADRLHEIEHRENYTPAQTYAELDAFQQHFGYPDFYSPLLDDDGPNDWIVEKYRNIPLEEVVAQEVNAFNAIVAGLEALTEEQLAREELFARVAEITYEHYHEHRTDIEKWLARQN